MENSTEKTAPKKLPYWQNHFSLEKIERNLKYTQKLIQDAISSCPVKITLEELKSCLGQDPYRKVDSNRIESLLRKKMLEKVDLDKIRAMGLRMSEENVKGLISIPDYHDFSENLRLFSKAIPGTDIGINVITWEWFVLNDGIVSQNTEVVEKAMDVHQDYSENDV